MNNVRILRISGAVAAAPEGYDFQNGLGTTAETYGRTTAVNDELVVCIYCVATNAGETITPNSQTDLGTLGNSTTKVCVAYTSQPTAGATGNKTATLSGLLTWLGLASTIPPALALGYKNMALLRVG